MAFALAAAALGGCFHHTPATGVTLRSGTVAVIDRRTNEFTNAEGPASINGTYGPGCRGRSGAWSAPMHNGPNALALDYPALMTVEGDEDCVLALTAIRTSDGRLLPVQRKADLGDEYLADFLAFGEPPAFYVNAKVGFSNPNAAATLTLVWSDAPLLMSTPSDEPTSYSALAQGGAVPAPDYHLDIAGLSLQIDAHDVVASLDGRALLYEGSVSASGYAIAAGRVTSYEALDVAYQRGQTAFAVQIAGDAFSLLGADLTTPQMRTLILANEVSGVRSYQAFALTFAHPASSTH